MITLDRLNKGSIMDKKPETKVCNKCKVPKPIKDFTRDMTMADGRYNTCKPCTAAHRKAYRAEKNKHNEEFFNPNTPAF
jgi:hypothetical protein